MEYAFRNNDKYTTEVQELFVQKIPGEDGVRDIILKFRTTGSVLAGHPQKMIP